MRFTALLITAVFILSSVSGYAYNPPAAVENMPVSVQKLSETPDGLTLEIGFQTPFLQSYEDGNGQQWLMVDLPGAVPSYSGGGTALPELIRLVEVPSGYRVIARIVDSHEVEYSTDHILPRDAVRRAARSIQQLPAVEAGDPVWIRYLHAAPVVLRPARFLPDENRVVVAERMTVEFEYVVDPTAELASPDPDRYYSEAFDEVFRALLLNPRSIPNVPPLGRIVQRGSYVIITDEYLAVHCQALAEWKRRKGYNVVIEPMVVQGISEDEIRDYLQDAYDNWERPPEFILLVGDVNMPGIQLPSFIITNPTDAGERDVTDLPYVLLEGDDYFPDAFIGRISVDSPSPTGVRNALGRIVYQDKTPDLEDPDFYHRATLFGCNFGEGDRPISSPVETLKWLRDRLVRRGYDVEEFYFENVGDDISPDPIVRSINRDGGVNIVCYRGWADAHGTHYPQFYKEDLDRLNNGPMLPVATFFVCNVGDFGNRINPCFGEYSLTRGTVRGPNGFVAFFGPSDLHTSTKFNNPMLAGYYSGIMDHYMRTLGPLTLRAKLELWRGFPHYRDQGGEQNFVEFYFHVYNLLGDPEMTFHFDAPRLLQVEHPEQLAVGDSYTRFVVTSGGRPVYGALITMLKDNETRISILTDRDGVAVAPVQVTSEGELKVTVLAFQSVPYNVEIPVETAERMVGIVDVDVIGIEDDRLIAGEAMRISVTLHNTGRTSLPGVTASLEALSDSVEVLAGEIGFGGIGVGLRVQSGDLFRVNVSPGYKHTSWVPFQLNIRDGDGNEYRALFRLLVSAAALVYVDHEFSGGVLNPGGDEDLVLSVFNYGTLGIDGLRAVMHCHDESIVIEDSEADFGDMGVGDTVDCSDDPFHIRVRDGTAEGRQVQLRTIFINDEGRLVDRVFFNVTIGTVGPTNPLGPDPHGYYAYENIDVDYEEAPDFNWIELDSAHDGRGGLLHEIGDDTLFTMPLPFDFVYYGRDYDSITVCDNGWMAFGETWMYIFRNWPIPSPLGPPAMLAPFWDDLINEDDENNRIPMNVFTRYDENEGRFIVEWSRALARTSIARHEETFEVILYDPDRYQTRTGDGEIVFQYNEVEVVDEGRERNYASVGIQDHSHLKGLEVTFANFWAAAVDTLRPGRAIKFTTDPPDGFEDVSIKKPDHPVAFELSEPFPNPFNAVTHIIFSLPKSGQAKLSLWDLSGRQVQELLSRTATAGVHSYTFDAGSLPSGIYILRLQAEGLTAQRKLLLLR